MAQYEQVGPAIETEAGWYQMGGAGLMRLWQASTRVSRFFKVVAWPWFDLAIRLELAVWGMSYSLTGGGPISVDGGILTDTLTGIGLFASVLLLFGLGSRFAAMVLLGIAVHSGLGSFDQALPLATSILLGWYIIMGAGSISLGRLLHRGVADMALPFATPVSRICSLIIGVIDPIYHLLMRVFIVWVLFGAKFQVGLLADAAPLALVQVGGAILLVVGVFTRGTAISLIAIAAGAQTLGLEFGAGLHWTLLLAILFLEGPGSVSLDHFIDRRMAERARALGEAMKNAMGGLPHVVIVGAGFAGLEAARKLADTPCRITLIDRRNYHLFQPLLYQVATATLSPADIAVPIRSLLRDQKNIRVLLGRVTDVDADGRAVLVGDTRITYDYLILATGAGDVPSAVEIVK